MKASKATGPLAGLRVVELGHVMAGPTCGMMLADLGAEVIKVERLPRGDDTRRFVPPDVRGESAAFMMMNRNKRGLAVNLRSDGGRAALRRVIGTAGVFVENYRPGALDEMGLGYETLRKDHRALIYCSVTGFGRTGPFSSHGGLDLIAQGMSGLMSITGEGPGRPPVKVGAPMTDITAGILAAMGVLAAHIHRLATGEGQLVDTSLFEAGITHTYWQSAIALAGGVSPGAMGSAHPLSAPYQAFETADGWITVGAANQRNWERLTRVLEAEELLEDPRFADNAARMAHRLELEAALSGHFRHRSTAAWLEAFEAAGLPGGPVLSIEEMHDHPQTRGRAMLVATDHPVAGRVESLGPPVKLSASPANVRRPAPLLGEHTREVLAEAGYAAAEIEALIVAGDVAAAG